MIIEVSEIFVKNQYGTIFSKYGKYYFFLIISLYSELNSSTLGGATFLKIHSISFKIRTQ